MHVVRVVLFSMVLLSLLFSQPLTIITFQLNKNFIAKNLCENRSKPKMQCNGKCKLGKKLAEENSNNEQSFSFAKVEVISYQSYFAVAHCPENILSVTIRYSVYKNPFHDKRSVDDLLRPPQQII